MHRSSVHADGLSSNDFEARWALSEKAGRTLDQQENVEKCCKRDTVLNTVVEHHVFGTQRSLFETLSSRSVWIESVAYDAALRLFRSEVLSSTQANARR